MAGFERLRVLIAYDPNINAVAALSAFFF